MFIFSHISAVLENVHISVIKRVGRFHKYFFLFGFCEFFQISFISLYETTVSQWQFFTSKSVITMRYSDYIEVCGVSIC